MSEPSLFDQEAAPEPEAEAEGRSEAHSEGRTGARRLAFERLAIVRTPGFEEGGFALEGLASGVNLVYGPNASGKSTTARAIRALLWPRESGVGTYARIFDLAGERWEIDVDRDRVRHRRAGEPSGPPPLPPAATADRYSLALHDLLQAEARGDDWPPPWPGRRRGATTWRRPGKPPAASRRRAAPRSSSTATKRRPARSGAWKRGSGRPSGRPGSWRAGSGSWRRPGRRKRGWRGSTPPWRRFRCRARRAEARSALARFSEASERLTGDEERTLEEHRRRLAEARSTGSGWPPRAGSAP